MSFTDHDRFVAKNRSLASAEDIKRKDDAMERKGYTYLKQQKESSCFSCKMKSTCREFNAKKTGGITGVVSYGGDQRMICDKYEPANKESKTMTDKQVKSLMKSMKRGL